MNRYCMKYLMFTKNNGIKIKCEIDGNINLCSRCKDCGFEKFKTIDKEEVKDLLKVLT